jgi:hypothetical protein
MAGLAVHFQEGPCGKVRDSQGLLWLLLCFAVGPADGCCTTAATWHVRWLPTAMSNMSNMA